MRVRRTAYLVVFVVASLVAAGAYWLAQPRTQIVRATTDVPVLTEITADMVELIRVSPLDVPPDAARSLDAVVGQYAAVPILAGQDVDVRALEAIPGSQVFGFGAPLGPGQIAFALPVTAEQAVGGALAPGAHVDVIAVPNDAKTGAPAASGDPGTVSLGQGLTILALRSTDGRQLAAVDTGSTGGLPAKLGSVVVAIPAARLTDFATAALTSTFYLGLDAAAPAATAGP
jgi:Flp pilus assembly protein CpaB